MVDQRTVICKFCQCTMKVEKDMDKVMKHMDKAHEIFFNTELWMTVNFLNHKEIEMLTSKIRPRIEMFIARGTLNQSDNIFYQVPDEVISQKPELEIDAIQNLLQDENDDSSDSDSEGDESLKVLLQDENHDSSDSEDESLSENPAEANVLQSSSVDRNEIVKSNIDIGQKRKAADGFETQKDAVLGWLDSDEESDNESSEQGNNTFKTVSRNSKTISQENNTKRSKLQFNVGKKRPELSVPSHQEKETLVNSVDDFIMSLQSQRKKV